MPKKQLTLIPLIGIIYFTVSGGAFGLENVISGSGPGLGLLLLIITPILWSIPIALVTAELATMLPIDGGYYRWVYFSMGRFWGFQEGWWTWIYTFIDMAIYPVVFSTYLKYFWPGMTRWQQWVINLAVIFSCLVINWRGAKSVGHSAVIAFVLVTAAFLLLTVLGLPKIVNTPWLPIMPEQGKPLTETLGLGLSAVMWSYMGWDNVSTFAGEVKNPGRTFPRAMIWSVVLVTILYLLPITVTLSATSNWASWDSDNFTISQIAGQLVAPWLGALISIGVMFSNWSMFNSQLLYASRLPFAMAEDGLLPQQIKRTHKQYGTPVVSLILCSLIYSLFSLLNFKELVIIDVLIYALSLLLEYVALIRLRITHPDLARPFKIPGGWFGISLSFGSMLLFVFVSIVFTLLSENDWQQLALAAGLLATGPIVYAGQWFWHHRRKNIVINPHWIQKVNVMAE